MTAQLQPVGRSGSAAGMPSARRTPELSVVVPVYNDAARLPAAVHSALGQHVESLEVIICDDASTDGTQAVAARLCAEDPRVRFVGLAQNSGSAAAPRNAGLHLARARWVTFLDSDDELAAGALTALLESARDSEAQIIAGKIARLSVEERRWSGWCTQLYEQVQGPTSIDAEPGLFYDTAAVGKLYRTEFLRRAELEFAPGLLYEDCLWTAQAYASSEQIVLIPELVYVWKVYEGAGRRSVTNDRASTDNVRGRLRANRLIDSWLVERGHFELLPHKQLKFLRHDLSLYMGDLVSADDAWAGFVMREFQEYVAAIPTELIGELPLLDRLGIRMLTRGDVEGTRAVYRAISRGEFASDLVCEQGQVVWSARRSRATAEWTEDLDVTDLRIGERPFLQLRLAHDLRSWTTGRGFVRIVIRTWNPLARVPAERARVWLELTPRSPEGFTERFPGRVTRVTEFWFESVYQLERRPLDRAPDDDRLALAVVVQVAGADNVGTVPYPPSGLDLPASGWLLAVRSVSGDLGVRDAPTEGYPGFLQPSASGSRSQALLSSLGRAADAMRKRTRRRTRPRLAVFCSEGGRAYAGNPKYLHQQLTNSGWDGETVWVRSRGGRGFPEGVETVQKGSRQYYLAMGSAGYWIDDTSVPAHVRKPSGTFYLHAQDWLQRGQRQAWARFPGRDADGPDGEERWDQAVGSGGDSANGPREVGHRQLLASAGIPRLDPLTRGSGGTSTDLIDVVPRVEVAPTEVGGIDLLLTPSGGQLPGAAGLMWPPEDAAQMMIGRGRILFAAPPADRWRIPAELGHVLVDVGRLTDWSDALLAGDVLLTADPFIWPEYLLLDRPVIVYRDRRVGGHLDGPAIGPVVRSARELTETLDSLSDWADDYSAARNALRQRTLRGEDGCASARVVSAVFGVGGCPHG